LLLLLAASLTAAKAWIIQPTVDAFLAGPTDRSQLWLLAGVVFAIFTAQALFNWLYLVVARMAGAGLVQAIRLDLFHHLQHQGLRFFTTQSPGDLIARVVNDLMVFEASAVTAMQGLIRNGLTIALLFAVMMLQEPMWGLLIFTVMVVGGLGLRAIGARIVTVARAVQESLSRITSQLTEMTGGIGVILGFGVEQGWQAKFERTCREQYDRQVRSARIRGTATALVELMTGITLATLLFLMGSALLRQELTAGQMLSFLAVMFLMQAPAQRMAQCVAGLSGGLAAGARAFELLDREPDIPEPTNPLPLPPTGGAIEFRAVSFGYDDAPVIEDLSFRIEPGQIVAMVGGSGAGKSTVTRLAKRFYDPSEGQVLIDGVDVRRLERHSLHQAVSYVAQDEFLFDETLAFNIAVGRPQASDADLAEAVRLAALDDVAAEFPEGLGTRVGVRGARLSGGQRQRVAIARALLSQARILILDEATSALDTALETRILNNLVGARHRRTVLAITHRAAVAGIADRVLVMRGGRLVESGPGAELAGAGGEFSRLQRSADPPGPDRPL
jgi:subfamily B ATP-binding cassette protein MsbA